MEGRFPDGSPMMEDDYLKKVVGEAEKASYAWKTPSFRQPVNQRNPYF